MKPTTTPSLRPTAVRLALVSALALAACAPASSGSGGGEGGGGADGAPGQSGPDLDAGSGGAADGAPSCTASRIPDAVDYGSEIAPLLSNQCSDCHGDSGGLDLSSHAAILAGGSHGAVVEPCDCEASLLYQKTGSSPPFGDRMPRDGPPYLADAERQLLCDWINQGAGETFDPNACGGPAADAGAPPACEPCGDGVCDGDESCETCEQDCGACDDPGDPGDPDDDTPPSFAGLDDVDEPGGARCQLTFGPAEDDVTPAADIEYRVYVGPRDGAIEFSSAAATFTGADTRSDGDAVTATVSLEPGTRQDLVVRATDAAGNEDDNTVREDCDLR